MTRSYKTGDFVGVGHLVSNSDVGNPPWARIG